MREIEIDGKRLRVPDAWDVFVFDGVRYTVTVLHTAAPSGGTVGAKSDDQLERSSGTSEPLQPKD